MSEFVIESITELFHLVKSLIPDGQEPVCVKPGTTVFEAIQKMERLHFSQLPVVEGSAVLGVFSYRSLAVRLLRLGRLKEFIGDLPVDEFVEQLDFVQSSDNWENILANLEKRDGVLVGGHTQLTGIVTTMDVLNYLRKVASPFVLVAEIEMSLRRIIRACVSENELHICAVNALSSKYSSEDAIPLQLTDMDFNDYASIIGNRENWPNFAVMFGESDWSRSSTTSKLFQVRNLRNDIFHFKRKIEQQDIQYLKEFRDWLQLKARAFEARHHHQTIGSATKKDLQTVKKRWDEVSFHMELAQKVSAEEVEVSRQILNWAKKNMPEIWWGKGKVHGSFIPGITHNGIWHQIIGVWTNGYVELQFQYMRGRPVFDDDNKRRELIQRLIEVPGIQISTKHINLRPSVPLATFKKGDVLTTFLNVLDWFVDHIHSAKPELTDRRVLRYQFWSQLLEKAKEKTSIHANISPSREHWASASSGLRGVSYNYVIRMQDAKIELYVDRGDQYENKRIFAELFEKRAEIEARFGDALQWARLDDKRASIVRYVIEEFGGLRNQHLWPDLQEKMIQTMVQFSEAIQPELNQLSVL
jgi:CBS domain-containing protein